MEQPITRHYRFEGFALDTLARELKAPDGSVVPLNARAFDALCLLLRHRDRMVGKDELLDQVWAGRVVEENTLTQAISMLRRAFGSGAGDHRYIVTVPGRGYRFVAEVEEGDPAESRQRRASDAEPLVGSGGDAGSVASPDAVPATGAPATASRRPARAWLALAAVVMAMLALGALAPSDWRLPGKQAPAPRASAAAPPITLAVRPFRSLSGGPADPELELGLADTLITRLSRSPGISIPALWSAQEATVSRLDSRAAGRALGVAYVVEGTTQRIGGQVRVNARLLSVADGKLVWSDTFDARLAQVFRLQDAIGQGIARSLALGTPRPAPRGGPSPCDGADAAAYRAYLRGQYQLQRPSPPRMQQALADFREAIDRDPTCARAWAGTAFAYRALVMTGDRDPNELFPLAKAAVARALAIDPDSAEAYASKGFIEFWYDWDWPRAEASLRHAIALNPNLAEAQMALAHLLSNIGRSPEAVPYARRAIALDPLSPVVNALGGAFLILAGENEEGQRRLQKTLELEPDSWHALRVVGARAERRGDKAAALEAMQRAVEISGGHSNTLAELGRAYVRFGDRAAGERVLAQLETRRHHGYLPATSLAIMANALGDTDRTLDLLEQAYRERDVRMSFVLRDWPGLRGNPRFQALLQRLRLPDTPANRRAPPPPALKPAAVLRG